MEVMNRPPADLGSTWNLFKLHLEPRMNHWPMSETGKSSIPTPISDSIINSYTLQQGVRDKTNLLNYFIANKMKNLIEHITEF